MTSTAGRWHARIDWYNQHRRPVARSNMSCCGQQQHTPGYAYLWMAIVADVGSMLVVTVNGLSLLERQGQRKEVSDSEA